MENSIIYSSTYRYVEKDDKVHLLLNETAKLFYEQKSRLDKIKSIQKLGFDRLKNNDYKLNPFSDSNKTNNNHEFDKFNHKINKLNLGNNMRTMIGKESKRIKESNEIKHIQKVKEDHNKTDNIIKKQQKSNKSVDKLYFDDKRDNTTMFKINSENAFSYIIQHPNDQIEREEEAHLNCFICNLTKSKDYIDNIKVSHIDHLNFNINFNINQSIMKIKQNINNKDYSKSFKQLLNLLSLQIEHSDIYYLLGEICRLTNHYDLSLLYLNKALNFEFHTELVYFSIGALYYSMKKYNDSITNLKRVTSNSPESYYYLSLCYFETEEDYDALYYINKALSIKMTDNYLKLKSKIIKRVNKIQKLK